MFKDFNSLIKLFIDLSSRFSISINLSTFTKYDLSLREVKIILWSDRSLISNPDIESVFLSISFVSMLSIKLKEGGGILVGNVILGKKPLEHIDSKYSLAYLLEVISNRFMLKSPQI